MKLFQITSWDRERLVLLGAVLALAALSIGAYRHFRPDPRLAKIRELGSQLRTAGRQIPGDERRQLGKELRDEMKKLTPEQRRELGKDRQERWRNQMKKFFEMSKEDQAGYLDRLIKQDEERRQRWQSRNDNNPQAAEERRQRSQEQNANGGPGGRGQRGGNGSPEDRESRRKQALDRSTPEDRAMRAEFRKMMQERRQQLGLPAQGGGAGRGRGQRT